MRLELSAIAEALRAELHGEDAFCTGVAIDSRKLSAGDLFVALPGERVDGHQFIDRAAAAGAAGAMVQQDLDAPLPVIRVADTRIALGDLGAWWRGRLGPRVVAVTGSNGKTTVKEMLTGMLREAGPTLATRGNLNNELGVPLTLLRLEPEHRFAVVEMGANHAGEIDRLAALASPSVGVITNAGPAHLEGFGSIEGVARAKGELFARLPATGTAVINDDDRFAPLWREIAGRRPVLSFAMHADADVVARPENGHAVLETPAGPIRFRQCLPGRHNLMNAAAAAAAALAVNLSPAAIRRGLENIEPVAGRLQPVQADGGYEVIDDSYNANPGSLGVGIEFLVNRPGEPWLVLGEMAELGPEARTMHAEAGRVAKQSGVMRLFTVGEAAEPATREFGAGADHFPDRDELIAALKESIQPGVCCLVKGSRSAGMEQVVRALLDNNDNHDGALRRASGGV